MARRVITFITIVIGLYACGGSLSEDQRQALHKEMRNREIKRVSDEEIYRAAMRKGKQLITVTSNSTAISTESCTCDARYVLATATTLSPTEQVLLEAYNSQPLAQDNVQKLGADSLMFTHPIYKADSLQGMWIVKYARRDVILTMD